MSSTPGLITELLALAECPRAGEYVCITARREHGVRSAHIDRPTLGVVLRGAERLQVDGGPAVSLHERHEGQMRLRGSAHRVPGSRLRCLVAQEALRMRR